MGTMRRVRAAWVSGASLFRGNAVVPATCAVWVFVLVLELSREPVSTLTDPSQHAAALSVQLARSALAILGAGAAIWAIRQLRLGTHPWKRGMEIAAICFGVACLTFVNNTNETVPVLERYGSAPWAALVIAANAAACAAILAVQCRRWIDRHAACKVP
jgi:hypothetical protein